MPGPTSAIHTNPEDRSTLPAGPARWLAHCRLLSPKTDSSRSRWMSRLDRARGHVRTRVSLLNYLVRNWPCSSPLSDERRPANHPPQDPCEHILLPLATLP